MKKMGKVKIILMLVETALFVAFVVTKDSLFSSGVIYLAGMVIGIQIQEQSCK